MSIDRSKSDEIHENSVKTQQHCQKGRCEEHRSKTSLRSISKLATCFQVVPVKPSAATNSAKRKKMDRVEGKSRKHAASIGAERRAPHIKNGAAAEENCEDGRLGRRRMHKWAAGLKYLRFLLNFLFFFPQLRQLQNVDGSVVLSFFLSSCFLFFFFKVEQVAAGPFLDGEIGDTQNGTVHLFVSDWGSPGRPQGGPRGLLPEATRKASSFAIRPWKGVGGHGPSKVEGCVFFFYF